MVFLECVHSVCATCDEQRVLARTGAGPFPPLGWSLISLAVSLPPPPYSIYCSTASTYMATAVLLSVLSLCPPITHSTIPPNLDTAKESIGGLILSAPISSYLLFSGTLADGPPEGHVMPRLTRRCQALMLYHSTTEERATSATCSSQ